MMAADATIEELLLESLTDRQSEAVRSEKRRLLVIAGAGSGKTDVMARRIAWWTSQQEVPREAIVAFTFTERAAEEMQFRVRRFLDAVRPEGTDTTLGGMYVGTIHGFCLQLLRELAPDEYHNFDVIDEGGAFGLVERGFYNVLGLEGFKQAAGIGHFEAVRRFLYGYGLLHEFDRFSVELPDGPIPSRPGREETEWCARARLLTDVGEGPVADAFASSAARYYAYLRCRRFLDFATSQSEAVRLLEDRDDILLEARARLTHFVVDEVQDVNPIQDRLIEMLVGGEGHLTAVGDHRQAIFAWRGGRVEIMADLHRRLDEADDGEIVELQHNFRSTPQVIELANNWSQTISPLGTMTNPAMEHGRGSRVDYDPSHVAAVRFDTCANEADWVARTIEQLVEGGDGARHDGASEEDRGLGYEDIVILLRSGADSRTFMRALEARGIPAIFRGSDLFAQPEVLVVVAALSLAAKVEQFLGAQWGRSLPVYINEVLGCDPEPEPVVQAACEALRQAGLPLTDDAGDRLARLARLLARRIDGEEVPPAERAPLRSEPAKEALAGRRPVRRVFPQAIYHHLLDELGVEDWDGRGGRAETAMYHLGALSSLITGVETPGWTSPYDFRAQMIALTNWGPQNARVEEAELLVQPRAVTISTVHGAKGLEFAAVFLADVRARRFPSSRAKVKPEVPFEGAILDHIDPAQIADNDNHDGERRLLYVALTRAERYLFITTSGGQTSRFYRWVEDAVPDAGGTVGVADDIPAGIELRPWRSDERTRLVSSFSDLRYYLECPHDFYLRKVLGFAPTIDQAFGYGRGVHNLMRAIHSDPARWAALAGDPAQLRAALEDLVGRGLFYLRYTTGDPLDRMRNKAIEIVAEYVERYGNELAVLEFEPEREFQTLIEEEQVLVSGAIDVIRRDDPPRVTLLDFKSGEAESDLSMKLDSEEMTLQISLYGLAAKSELEYEPDRGLVRYLGETEDGRRELEVPLTPDALATARHTVVDTAREIKDRRFQLGPRKEPRDARHAFRCGECDFRQFCGLRARVEAGGEKDTGR